MRRRTVSASRFEAECVSMLDEVAATDEELLVTKHGRPVARILPATESSLLGSVRFNVDETDLLAPIDVDWDAAR